LWQGLTEEETFEMLEVEETPPKANPSTFFFFFITLGLELSDTKVYEP
jgi:hypothetical protein